MSNRLKIVEHEPMVVTSYGTFPQSQVAEAAKNAAAAIRAAEEEQHRKAAEGPKGSCPFSKALNPTCRPDCAMYMGGGCSLKAMGGGIETKGRRCPFKVESCALDCMLYSNGCALLGRKEKI